MPNYLEKCAERMERTLNQKPRHPKTRAYVAKLPKVAKRKVSTEEFLAVTFQPFVPKPFLGCLDSDPPRNRVRIGGVVSKLIDAQGGRCGICGLPIDIFDATKDHVLPKALDGKDGLYNLLAAHYRCNQAKASRPPTAFELVMNRRKNERLQLKVDT